MVAGPAVAIILSKADSPSVTFYKDIQPILQQHCQSCHRSGQIAPMPLVSFDDARKYAAKMKQMTRTKNMPPWFADSQFGSFANDPSLTANEIQLISEWADAGAPAGDPR